MAILEYGNTNGGTATMGENIEERKRNAIAIPLYSRVPWYLNCSIP